MGVLAAGVALSVVLGLVNLALTFVVIRWVLRRGRPPGSLGGEFMRGLLLQPGAKVPELSVPTVSGESVSLTGMAGAPGLIGFFAVGCPPCHTQLPLFVDLAKTIPGGVGQVLAVVVGDKQRQGEGIGEYVSELSGAAAVAVEPLGGPAAAALAVKGYPAFYMIDDGQVQASSGAVPRLATRQPARN